MGGVLGTQGCDGPPDRKIAAMVAIKVRIVLTVGVVAVVLAGRAAGVRGESLPAEAPAQWTEVGSVEKRIEVLEFLAAQAEANYERLRTWRARYSLLGDVGYSRAYVRYHFRADHPWRFVVKGLVEFVVDKDSGATYYRCDRKEQKHVDILTGQTPVDDPNLRNPPLLPWDRVVVTPESYLHAHYGRAFGFLPEVTKRPEFLGRPLAYRDARSDTQDPLNGLRVYTFFTFFDREWVWDDLRRMADRLRKDDPKWKDAWRKATRVYEAKSDKGNWYKYDFEYTSPEGRQVFSRILFSPAAGYLPVEDLNERKAAGDAKRQVLRHRIWQYKLVSGVYVPSYFKEVNPQSEEIGADIEEQVLLDCEVNKPVDPVQFTWAGINLPEGTVVMDRVDNVAYVWQGGKLNKLSSLAEGAHGRGWTRWLRWVLAGLTLAALAAIGLVAWRRRPPRGETPGR